ncbi:phage tail protein [Mesorhizobium sp. B2-8-9]|uniref:phage tail protein n=1 Tax=Mesorhizobium sp. B2-8-9 TaxID=2589899 RepID=UPI00112CE80F|nr:phage tail protein [Mesorhizobium sp. B2-8-9]TPI86368.1 VWA domain-containing protein [Mesorhizobium sp. B2-8-9]
MGKSKPKQQVAEYRMSIHFGICAGAVDYISRIVIGEKEAWKGRVDSLTGFRVNKPDLFGGIKKEGGVSGTVTYLPGDVDQVMPEALAAKYGKTAATMPAYRGLSSVFFTEGPSSTGSGTFLDQIRDWLAGIFSSFAGSDRKGFYWTANSPYLRGVWVEAARASIGLEPAYARIFRDPTTENVALYFAIDISSSIVGVRINALKRCLHDAVAYLRARTDRSQDICFVSFSTDVVNSVTFRNASSADFDALDTFIDDLIGAGTSTDFSKGASQAATFFAGAGSKIPAVIFISDNADQSGDHIIGASAAKSALDDVPVYCFRVWGAGDTTMVANFLGTLDNTAQDGMPVLMSSTSNGLVSGLNPSQTLIPFDSNPAHMIYELLPYTDRGRSSAGTDKASFEAAALTLFNERFGISLLWNRQSTVEDFVKEIQDHIEAAIFLNPKTGLLTIKLIRGDYDPDTVPVFTVDNCVVTNFSRKLWGETINEIVVTWTNPENEEEETVTQQDLANISVQDGKIISDSRNYYGIRRSDLAAFTAQRDLRVAAAPLASCDLECDRTAWDLLPGDVIKLVSPEDGIAAIFMRVGPIDYGKPGDSKIKASLVEDIFSLPLAEYSLPPPPATDDSSEQPAPAAFAYIFTLPYYLVVHEIDPAASAGIDYPVVFAGVLAGQSGSDTHEFELIGKTTDTLGNVVSEDIGSRSIASHATLSADLAEEAESLIASFPGRTTGDGPVVGGFVVIGDGAESEVEFGLVTVADDTGYTIRRGVLDTVPQAWPSGSPVWFLGDGLDFVDNEQRSDGETVDYKILPRTSLGLLDEDAASWISTTLTGRPWLPFRPADVHVDGIAFGDVDATALPLIPVTWSDRNRLTEDSIVLAWDAATVTPETGQTTVIHLTDSAGTVVHTYSGITATSFDVDPADFGSLSSGYIVVKSERDGLESLQGVRRRVVLMSSLLLSGDQQDGADHIALSGDQAPGIILISGS